MATDWGKSTAWGLFTAPKLGEFQWPAGQSITSNALTRAFQNDLASLDFSGLRWTPAEQCKFMVCSMEGALTHGLENNPAVQQSPALLSSLTEQCRLLLDRLTANDLGAASAHSNRVTDKVGATVGKNHPLYGQALDISIAVDLLANHKEAALKKMKEGVAIDDQVIKELFAIGSEADKLKLAETYWLRMSDFLSAVVQMPNFPDNKRRNQAALNLVLRRKALAMEVSLAQRDAILIGRHPELKDRLEEWRCKKRNIAEKTLNGPPIGEGSEGKEVHRQELERLNRECERLEADLVERIPDLNRAFERQISNVDCESVAAALPENSVLIEFVQFQFRPIASESSSEATHYLALILPAREPEAVALEHLGESGAIDSLITEFGAVMDKEGGRFGRVSTPRSALRCLESVGNDLCAAVFDPLKKSLKGSKRLFLAPDGELTRIPFAALPCGDHYLLKDYDISYLSVGRDVLRFGPPGVQPTETLVVAAPDFDLAAEAIPVEAVWPGDGPSQHGADLHFELLDGMKKEGEKIAEMFKVPLHFGDEARVGWLQKACRSPRILHLASHAFFFRDQEPKPGRWAYAKDNPLLRAGLALAGANTWIKRLAMPADARDGILNGVDVAELDLLDTELVVLSACETGLGEEQKGEGIFGFRRAFVLAGARTLVMSLWKVPDEETKDLMIEFYQMIRCNVPRAEALLEAQRRMMQKNRHPYCWGAFICQGDPGPLSGLGDPPSCSSGSSLLA
jgi:CHAT domain-containing protein